MNKSKRKADEHKTINITKGKTNQIQNQINKTMYTKPANKTQNKQKLKTNTTRK